MSIIDFILNIAGLLLWLNWRSIQFDPLVKRLPATLMGTLRPATPKKLRPWHLLVFIAGLLLLRALIYWWIGSAMHWVGKLNLGVIVLSFRSNWFDHMLAYSFFSFALMLGIFYLGLLLLSLLKGPEPFHRLVKIPLGRLDELPSAVKIILPFITTAVGWWLASWLFVRLQVVPPPASAAHRIRESLAVGLGSYLVWKFPASVILLLHLLNSYIYFGKHPFWNYVKATAQKLLQPLKMIPLQVGRVDFAPVMAIAIIFFLTELWARGLLWIYSR